jgi:hypothetical protein
MATFTKVGFSGDSTGKGILVAATSTPGTTIHASTAGTTFDEVWIYATNNDVSAVTLEIEFGQTSNLIKMSIPATSGLTIIIPGLIVGPSLTVAAFASAANKVSLFGYVNRIS